MREVVAVAGVLGALLLAVAASNYLPTLSRGALNPLEFETGSAYLQLVWSAHNFTLIPTSCGRAYHSRGLVPTGPPPGAVVIRLVTPDGSLECAAWPRFALPPGNRHRAP